MSKANIPCNFTHLVDPVCRSNIVHIQYQFEGKQLKSAFEVGNTIQFLHLERYMVRYMTSMIQHKTRFPTIYPMIYLNPKKKNN